MTDGVFYIITKRDSPTLRDAYTNQGALVLESHQERAERSLDLLFNHKDAPKWCVKPVTVKLED